MKKSLRIPVGLLKNEEIIEQEYEYILVVHLRVIVKALKILGAPKTDSDYLELIGKTEDELIRDWNEYREYDELFFKKVIENEMEYWNSFKNEYIFQRLSRPYLHSFSVR